MWGGPGPDPVSEACRSTSPPIPAFPPSRGKGLLFRPQCLMDLSESALRVLERRYLRRDEAGHVVETPEEMVRRVARGLSPGGAPVRPEEPRRP